MVFFLNVYPAILLNFLINYNDLTEDSLTFSMWTIVSPTSNNFSVSASKSYILVLVLVLFSLEFPGQ